MKRMMTTVALMMTIVGLAACDSSGGGSAGMAPTKRSADEGGSTGGAPTFLEQKRADWMAERFRTLGWEAKLDRLDDYLRTLQTPEPKEPHHD